MQLPSLPSHHVTAWHCCCPSDGAAALETVELAHELRHRGVAGIDLSGNPAVGAWPTWLPALQTARELGLAVTLHCGEVDNAEEVRLSLRRVMAPNRLSLPLPRWRPCWPLRRTGWATR